jgi:predicted aspartyl protease
MNRTLLALAATLLASSSLAENAAPRVPCELKQHASLDVRVDKGLLVPVRVNGRAATMLLDTSAAMSTIYQDAAREHGFEQPLMRPSWGWTWNGVPMMRGAWIESLTVGDIDFGRTHLLVIPDRARSSRPSMGEIGLLGMDLFRRFDFELDLSHGKLRLFSQHRCPGRVVYWADTFATAPIFRDDENVMYFPLELEGRKIQAGIATDESATTVSVDVTRKIFGFDHRSPGVTLEASDDPGQPRAHYRAMRLTAPGLTVTNTRIRLLPSNKRCRRLLNRGGEIGYYRGPSQQLCGGAYPMYLGRNILQELRMYFATGENRVYFTAANAAN